MCTYVLKNFLVIKGRTNFIKIIFSLKKEKNYCCLLKKIKFIKLT